MQFIKKLLRMVGFKFEEEKKLKDFEEFYFRIRNALTAQVYLDAFYDESLPDAIPLAEAANHAEKINNTPVKLALSECFTLLDVYFGFNQNMRIEDIKLSVIPDDFKSRPDMIIKLLLPRLVRNSELSLDQIKVID